jgi:hypothetical protein
MRLAWVHLDVECKEEKKDEASGRQQRDVGGRNSSGNLAAR